MKTEGEKIMSSKYCNLVFGCTLQFALNNQVLQMTFQFIRTITVTTTQTRVKAKWSKLETLGR